ncbi:PAS domain S-box protein [Sphingobacterium oryzagri]|uniref:histidine kinase n=1 Tax=Sphingobacterium oryzagri TaxID=3025669 RepID=A0ABY7WDA7_9SPHI|nr:PAS domain S-box protein [Sphingobacterium sp. KACC 22765]WDF66855.1 PAS domain S-box protein [Sphingobacterium sp. KACC 22765]
MPKQSNKIEHTEDRLLSPLIYQALDSSASGIIITDNRLPDNPIIYHNAAFEKITGYTKQEIIGHNCRFLQADDRQQAERQKIKEAIQAGEHITVEIRNYKKNGDLFWNELYISPVVDEKGAVTHFIGVQNDVSRRKQVEEKLAMEKDFVEKKVEERTESLRNSQEYLNSIIETIREGLVVLDPNFKVLKVNKAFLKIFKVSEAETIDKLLFDLGNRQWDIQTLRELLLDILPTNNPVLDYVVEHDFPYIGPKTMLLNAHRIELEGSYKDRILLAIEDVTERREIEKRKDDFLSIASHELKTPLTAIRGYIQLLKRFIDAENAKAIDIVEKSDNQIERLNSLIAELLDVSKIKSGKLDIHHNDFDFDKMVKDTIESVQLSNAEHKILLNGHTGVICSGDETHLSQVVANLLSNAIKYSPDKEAIEVDLARFGDHIKVMVKDHGLGINDSDKRKIFERFYRVKNVQKKFSGMGIGLYICQQIILQHGGSIWVDSELGNGSTFSFTIPIKKTGIQNEE